VAQQIPLLCKVFLYVYIYIYMYVCVCSYTHISYTHILIYSYTHILIYSYTHVGVEELIRLTLHMKDFDIDAEWLLGVQADLIKTCVERAVKALRIFTALVDIHLQEEEVCMCVCVDVIYLL